MSSFMRGTPVDILLAWSAIALMTIIIALAVNPAQQFARAKDVRRIERVRVIMTDILQQRTDSPETFAAIAARLRSGSIFLVNEACVDNVTRDCLTADEDDQCEKSEDVYAIQIEKEKLTVRACGAITHDVHLTARVGE